MLAYGKKGLWLCREHSTRTDDQHSPNEGRSAESLLNHSYLRRNLVCNLQRRAGCRRNERVEEDSHESGSGVRTRRAAVPHLSHPGTSTFGRTLKVSHPSHVCPTHSVATEWYQRLTPPDHTPPPHASQRDVTLQNSTRDKLLCK